MSLRRSSWYDGVEAYEMIRLVLIFVIIAIGCVAVGLLITKIIAAIVKMKDDFEKGEQK